MKFYLQHIDRQWDAVFESSVEHFDGTYGNGNYITILRNGEMFAYLDCRYCSNFDERSIVERYLRNYYGSNFRAIDVVDCDITIERKEQISRN